ncbi:Outer membrane protein transport protein domain-containing protein [Desulfonema limicola]|uniref:Outer membrane protein transport protein domain-containing protein n=1 Tax=Desulfonema limicola TaxID=45656 RepID=A0A975GHL2_9BACT|nr:outer membrane protein transport protein [Desulfonema limicola]QTA81630.1 Outer membrane protein transport protein domain-containing protein [Desulfonema limicola]
MKKILLIILTSTMCFMFHVIACSAFDLEETIQISSSLNPVGSGARALGMGGAFIAVADDATAASWNPGGLMQLETPEISIVGSCFHRIEDISFGVHPEADGDQSVDLTGLNYFSAAYPFALFGYNMIVSLNYQHLYDLTRQWNFTINNKNAFDTALIGSEVRQEGGLSALGLAYSIQITPDISAGITFNIWDDDFTKNKWENKVFQWGGGSDRGDQFIFEYRDINEYSLDSGFNLNLGVMWNINSSLSLGAVLKTPFEADLSHEQNSFRNLQYPNLPGFGQSDTNKYSEDMTLSMPMSYGIGAGFRFSDNLTVSFDIYRTEWGDFELEDSKGKKTSPISGRPVEESNIDATHQVRIGAEYLFIKPKYVIPLRCGMFYDPSPAESSPDDFFGFSLGSGISYKSIIFDTAYQYRFADNVGSSILESYDFSQDVSEHTIYISLIYHF